jgi:RHS repeat-associated protein
MGRRVQKTVYAYSAGSWVQQKELLFVYGGWNVVEELTREGGSDTRRYFVWDLDLSQSLQIAGGVGGLLAMVDGASTYHYCFDANGNVGQLVNAANGEVAAHYEFDPFGNIVAQNGSMADDNPFRFSTKYHDAETNLCFYGHRYYSADVGRWISRDQLGEAGGLNEKWAIL